MTRWHEAKQGEVHKTLMEYVHAVEKEQRTLFDRFVKLEKLYDPNAPHIGGGSVESDNLGGRMDMAKSAGNVIAANVDTVAATISSVDVRARFITDGGDWSEQRQARTLEWYIEALQKLLNVNKRCRAAFKEGAIKGVGLVKVFADQFNRPRVKLVLVDNIIVDESTQRGGADPMELHERIIGYDIAALKAEFPDKVDEIDRAGDGAEFDSSDRSRRSWAGRRLRQHEIVVVESYRLPIGVKGKDGYLPGRRTICTQGVTLLDEEYHKEWFPYAQFVWSERARSFYGISGAERIAGRQNVINKRLWQIDRSIDNVASPAQWVQTADANIAVKTINRFGTIGVYKAAPPVSVTPQAVSPEVYQDLDRHYMYSFREFGASELDATGSKPAGLDSGRALREYRDATSQRHAPQAKAFEALVLDTLWLLVDVCKDLGREAPVIERRFKYKTRKIAWQDINTDMTRVQISAASTLGRTPAARAQTATEWAQIGAISIDEWRRLTEFPDEKRTWSLYTAAIEDIERDIDLIEEGEVVIPEPLQNLRLGEWRMQQAYLLNKSLGAPEEILEAFSQWIQQSVAIREIGNGETMPQQQMEEGAAMAGAPQVPGLVEPPGVGAPLPPMLG